MAKIDLMEVPKKTLVDLKKGCRRLKLIRILRTETLKEDCLWLTFNL